MTRGVDRTKQAYQEELNLQVEISTTRYRGTHILQFGKTSPDNSAEMMFIDGRKIGKTDLIAFLRFEKPIEWYQSSFRQYHRSE